MIKICLSFVVSLIITAVLLKVFIPVLRKVKLGQKILEIGPNWHKSKEGTPTMGGLFFITGIAIAVLVFALPDAIKSGDYTVAVNLGFAVLTGAVGFIDDYVKLFKKQNKGLSPAQKMAFLIVTSGAYLWVMNAMGKIDTKISIPLTDLQIELGVFYYIIAILVMVYLINCANLTDGIDGLAGSVSCIIMTMFFIFSLFFDKQDMGVFSAAVIGALLAFLYFNFYPAKVFMGDTGSLFLGSVTMIMGFWTNASILIFFIGLIYFIEGVSVLLQVGYYKLTKKRIFKMAPIHHHFEMKGWSELKIVGVFSAVTVVCCAVAYVVLYFNNI